MTVSVNGPQEAEGARCQVSLLSNFDQNVFLCRVKFRDIQHHFALFIAATSYE